MFLVIGMVERRVSCDLPAFGRQSFSRTSVRVCLPVSSTYHKDHER